MKFSHFLIMAVTMALGVSSFSAQAEKREQTSVKTNQRSVAKSTVTIGDVPNHEVFQETLISSIKYSNPDFKVSEEWVYSQTDQVDGSGTHRCYWIDFHHGGEQTYGTCEGAHKTVAKDDGSWLSTWEGKYRYLGGTGKFKNIKGTGTYKGKVGSKEPFIEEAREQIEF
ncbi:MAG: hypothetical protein HY067_20595 [Betaproteobacteria bacterium]|nr:hypothetical protein [Betaproteobacteria bacterium]